MYTEALKTNTLIGELDKDTPKVYLAEYLTCFHEGEYITLSVHKTYEGAKRAIEIHKAFKEKEFKELNGFAEGFADGHDWVVNEMELKY